MAAALDKSDVIDEIVAAGSKAVAVAGDISAAVHRRRAGRDRRRPRRARHRRQQRGHHPRPHAVQHVRRGLGRGHRGAPARPLPADPQRRHLLAREGQGGRATDQVYGRIINTSSEAGLVGPVGQANYGAAKAGITALTLTAARALERYGVRANAIAPRARTAMTADVFGDAPELAEGQIDPLSPEHVVTLVRFLASPASRRRQRPAVHRLRSDGDAGGGADGRAAIHVRNPTHGTRPSCRNAAEYFADRDPERSFSATALMESQRLTVSVVDSSMWH